MSQRGLDASGPLLDVKERDRGAGERRSVTLSPKRIKREVQRCRELPGMRAAMLRADRERPRRREECRDGPRPCVWTRCRYHLYLDVDPITGSVKLNHPGLELEELEETCALDVADRGGATLDQVGELLGLTRQRADQLETMALERVRLTAVVRELAHYAPRTTLERLDCHAGACVRRAAA